MAKSDPTVAALDAATPRRGGVQMLVDTFTPETQAAIRRAAARGVSNRTIAETLRATGVDISEGAVRNWLRRRG